MKKNNPYKKAPNKGVKAAIKIKAVPSKHKNFSHIVHQGVMSGKSVPKALADAYKLGGSQTMQNPDNIPGTPNNQGPIRPGW